MLTLLISTAFLVALLVYGYFSLAHFQKVLPFSTNNILFVTAHPDDECMFFGPTITSLKTMTKSRVHVLCLSTGNADGLGVMRKKELVKSCQTFNIPSTNVKSLDLPELQDGMKNQWDSTIIARVVKDYVTKQRIDTIITFDGHGVSGHPNHIAAYNGARAFVQQENTNVQLYTLTSVSLIRKYIGIFDLMVPSHPQSIQFISSPLAYLLTHKAMRQHVSQLVWFRWLYVTFSRYMFVNDLVKYHNDFDH